MKNKLRLHWATLGLGMLLQASVAMAQSNTWAQMSSPNPSPERNLLRGISGTSPTDVWAVGDYQTSPPGLVQYTQNPLIIHWDGSAWAHFPVQTFGDFSSFWDVEAIAPNNVWAVGDFAGGGGGAQSQIAHWDGTSWTNVHHDFPVPGSWSNTTYLWSVDAINAGDIWAVGGKAGVLVNPCFAYHYDGTSWTDIPVPTVGTRRNRFTSVDGIASNDVWAVGSWGDQAGEFRHLAMHWNGSTWTNYPMPATVSAIRGELLNVKMVASNDVWAVGDLITGGMVTVHWDGTSWTEINTNGNGAGGDFAVLAPNNIYSVGSRISHWDGTNWSVVDTLGNLPYPALIATTVLPIGEIWAAGRNIDFNDKFYTLVYRYSNNGSQISVGSSSPSVPLGAAVQLLAQPATAGNYTYRWSSSDGSIIPDSTSATPTVSPMATTTYAVNMTDATGYSVQGWVKVEVAGVVALPQTEILATIMAFPNPFTDKVEVQLNSANQQNAQFLVTDVLGRVVYASTSTLQPGDNRLQVPVLGQPAGIYSLRVIAGEQLWQVKLVKE